MQGESAAPPLSQPGSARGESRSPIFPVLLHEEADDRWLHGSLEDVLGVQGRCFPDELAMMERTQDP